MIERELLKVNRVGDTHEFTLNLTELGGKIIALYPRKLKSLQIQTAKMIKRGSKSAIRFSLQDTNGVPLSGLQPLEVTITDASGKNNEFSGYYCAKHGVLDIDFVAALNDDSGRWVVSASDLTAGLTAKAEFEVVK
jgi:hypothetical protein